MSLIYSIKIALETLKVNKLRSILTMLGIIIGVSAVILMVAIMQGLSYNIKQQFNKMGSNLIIIVYEPPKDNKKGRKIDGFTMRDVHLIAANCPLVGAISPEMPVGNSVEAQSNGRNMLVNPIGVMPDYSRLRNVPAAQGRFISDSDASSWAQVCVIGSKVKTTLFPDVNPIGQRVEVDGLILQVVGVAISKGRSFSGDADINVYMPLTTVQKRLLGSDRVGAIYAQPVSTSMLDQAQEQVWQTLMQRYSDVPGIKVDTMAALLSSIQSVFMVFTIVLGSIAGLALLVGGIGIMNIMLVSVTERTREIGVRKAVGAKRRDILRQFLIESATLSGVGGLTGVIVGTLGSYALGYITTFIPQLADKQSGHKGLFIYVPPWIVIGAFVFSATVGIFFGMYPAIRASRLDPIVALRHE